MIDRNEQLSPNFSLAELTVSDSAARLRIDNTPDAAVLANLRRLAHLLEDVRELLGRPLVITSGFRAPKLNRAVGGSATSVHVIGLAADFIAPPLSAIQACRRIAE